MTLPMPRLEATVSEITVPTKASVIATFSEAKKYGIVRGKPTFHRMSSLRGVQRTHHVFQFRLGGGEPGRDVHHDRERCT